MPLKKRKKKKEKAQKETTKKESKKVPAAASQTKTCPTHENPAAWALHRFARRPCAYTLLRTS